MRLNADLESSIENRTDPSPGVDAQIMQEGQQPVAGLRVVVAGQNLLNSRGVVGTGGQIGAEKQEIAGTQQRGQPRHDDFRFKIGNHAEESDHMNGGRVFLMAKYFGQIICAGEVADQRMAAYSRNGALGGAGGCQDESQADVAGRVGYFPPLPCQ